MAAPVGSWVDGPNDSKVKAIHACLLHTGKVLIFHCRSYPMWSRLYDSTTNLISDDNQVVPIWPEVSEERPFIEPSSIFCSGHCCLPNGKVLVAGGEKIRPYPYDYLPPEAQWSRGLVIVLYLIRKKKHGAYHLILMINQCIWMMEDGILL